VKGIYAQSASRRDFEPQDRRVVASPRVVDAHFEFIAHRAGEPC
jgi:hypothetical protein